MKDRREVYEEYCRDVGRARRLGKTTVAESKKQDPERDYKALLREEVTSTRTRWDDFRKKWKRERRFYSFGRDDKDREKAFKTHLKELGERQSSLQPSWSRAVLTGRQTRRCAKSGTRLLRPIERSRRHLI